MPYSVKDSVEYSLKGFKTLKKKKEKKEKEKEKVDSLQVGPCHKIIR